MSKVILVNIPFNKKQSLEPEEEEYFDVYDRITFKNLDEKRKKQYLECKVGLSKSTTATPIYDISEIPIWVTGLSGILKKKGIEHSFLDLNVYGVEESQLESRLKETGGKIFLISSFTNNTNNASFIARKIKENIGEQTTIVYGGHHATFLSRQILEEQTCFDIIVRNEGEETLDELLEYLSRGKDIVDVKGITFRQKGEIVETVNRPLSDLGDIPHTNLDILPEPYKSNFYGRVFTSRGCSMHCSFCAEAMWNKSKPRFYHLDYVMEEIEEMISKLGTRYLFINDENFVMNKTFSREFAKQLSIYNIPWSCQTRVNLTDENLFRLMRDCNCEGIFYGAESGSQEVLDKNNKKIKLNRIYEACRLAKKAGLQVTTNWLVGLAGETDQSAMQTINMAEELINTGLTDGVEYYIAVPYPGTPLYRRPNHFGIKIREAPFSEYREDSPSVLSTNDLTYEDIFRIWKLGLRRLSLAMEKKI